MQNKVNIQEVRGILFGKISQMKDLDGVIDLFLQNIRFFDNIDILYVNQGESNDLSKPLKLNFDFKKGAIYSNFESNEIYILNQEAVLNASFQRNYSFGTLFDISVDTQIVSYIDRRVRGVSNSQDINDVVDEITKKRIYASSMNPTPYLLENCLRSGTVSKETFRNVYNFFKTLYISHSKSKMLPQFIAYIKSKFIVASFRSMYKRKVFDIFHDRYKIIYVMMMKMYLISVKDTSYEKKVVECIKFCDEQLKRIPMAELILSFEFFRKGTELKFFSKFQKKHKNMKIVIENSAWDIFHLRILDIYMTTVRHKKARLTLPFFFSMDKRLNDIAELIKFKIVVVDHNNKISHPFFSNSIVTDTMKAYKLEKYFTFEAHKRRISQKSDLDCLIRNLEEEIEKYEIENTN